MIKALQVLKSAQNHDGIRREWKTIGTALAGWMRGWNKRRDSYLCLVKRTHSLTFFRLIDLVLSKAFTSIKIAIKTAKHCVL